MTSELPPGSAGATSTKASDAFATARLRQVNSRYPLRESNLGLLADDLLATERVLQGRATVDPVGQWG